MNLFQYFLDHGGLPIHKNLHYFAVYQQHLAPFANRPAVLFEIGTGGGGSSQMWKRYLGPLARIVTIDHNPNRAVLEDPQVKVRIGEQSDGQFLSELIEEFGQPDIVIDDGSHLVSDITASFRYLYPRTSHNGVYFVESAQTSYWPEFGGGFRKPGSFLELCKDLIDELNAEHSRGMLPPTQFTQQTMGLFFYNSMIVFQRGRYLDTRTIVTGATSDY